MNEKEFLDKLSKIIPELVYSDSLLDSESIEIPIYFCIDEKGNIILDEEGISDEFNDKLNKIREILSDCEQEDE